jgi:hypothetical protein
LLHEQRSGIGRSEVRPLHNQSGMLVRRGRQFAKRWSVVVLIKKKFAVEGEFGGNDARRTPDPPFQTKGGAPCRNERFFTSRTTFGRATETPRLGRRVYEGVRVE